MTAACSELTNPSNNTMLLLTARAKLRSYGSNYRFDKFSFQAQIRENQECSVSVWLSRRKFRVIEKKPLHRWFRLQLHSSVFPCSNSLCWRTSWFRADWCSTVGLQINMSLPEGPGTGSAVGWMKHGDKSGMTPEGLKVIPANSCRFYAYQHSNDDNQYNIQIINNNLQLDQTWAQHWRMSLAGLNRVG